MEVSAFFPFWNQLTPEQQGRLQASAELRQVPAGTVIHNGSMDCVGLLLMDKGQLRSYILSDEGREITLYRLFERDICLLSASCMMTGIQFDITIQAEKGSSIWIVSPTVCKALMNESAAMANYINEIMAGRFSEVMWLMEQVLWKSQDKRLAEFLLQEIRLEGSPVLTITHEAIANHLGTAREVVTRMLRYFQTEGLVKLTRGHVEVLNEAGLEALADV